MTSTELVFESPPAASGALVFGDGAGPVAGPVVSSHTAATPDLVFQEAPATGGELVFGDDAGYIAPSRTADISGMFEPLTVSLRLVPNSDAHITGTFESLTASVLVYRNVHATVTGSFAPITASMVGAYDNRVTRYLNGRLSAPHQAAIPQRPIASSEWGTSLSKRGGTEAHWQPAARGGPSADAAFNVSDHRRAMRDALWQLAQRSGAQSTAGHQTGEHRRANALSAYQLAAQLRYLSASGFQAGINRRYVAVGQWQPAKRTGHDHSGRSGASGRLIGKQFSDGRWQHGQWPHTGRESVIPVAPPGACYTPSGDLLFSFPWDGSANILFQCGDYSLPPALVTTLYILPARFYMTAHSIYAQRLPDQAEVPIFDATVSADAGSYCWTLSASGPQSLFDQLTPTNGFPVQLRLVLDGIPWVFAVDSLSRSASFGKSGVSISGRSVTALIGAPYLRAITRNNTGQDRTAQQLALDALEFSGVDLDWGLTDWLVPAGAWSHQGTPLDAVQTIAQAAGGYLQSHRSAPTLLTRHPYGQRMGDNPGAPWSWMTGPADVELAPDAIITDGTERKDGADINAVYVSGTTAGVLGLVKRTGSAGDKLASMIADPLITHAIAARQRGLAVLGAAGSKYNVRLELPVLTGLGQPGVLDVGQLVQVNAAQPWRGRVRSVSVAAKRPSLRQTVTLERHLEIA